VKQKFKSPLEWLLKKNFEEMSRKEFVAVKHIYSLLTALLLVAGFYFFAGTRSAPLIVHICIFILSYLAWYFFFWASLCKKRNMQN